jgi:hypothetical protein
MTPMNWGVSALVRGVGVKANVTAGRKVSNLRARSWEMLKFPLTRTSSARFLTVSRESFEVTVSGGSTFARVKLKEIDGMAPQDVERAV